MNVKSPNVRAFMGKVISISIGFINMLIRVNTTVINRAVLNPAMLIPGIIQPTSMMIRAKNSHFKSIFIIEISLYIFV